MKLRTSLTALITLLLAAGCGGGGGTTSAQPSAGAGLEKTRITVGSIPVVDTAPLQLGIAERLFADEGLDVKVQMLAGGAEAIPKLKKGSLDISFGNYVSFFGAASKKVLDLKVVADGFQSAPKTHVIMVPKDSPITSPADLKDRTIAVNTRRNIGTLLVRVAASAHGVELNEERDFVEFPFPDMESVLRAKKVDAAMVVEPFGTLISQSIGGKIIWDTSQGATADFPIAGYATTAEFAQKNPKTLAAFQRAMAKAQALAADRAKVVSIIPTYTTIQSPIAGSLAIGSFPTSVSASRLQRVADLMREYGLLENALDVGGLIVPTSG
ncbi:ABC transporter substrate-binding protein [Spongiactinospora sp. TRM90649]|uniref:ABC transporter substrate-binding protein n=1 Tax=Spongiactinospora sp. TRM90649 TaxID=3031114 RepID=UPI0023F8664E|nr:ABC transporter substrate-binding protein [Spongiactinospora sp. TRM90649]MDF5752691.1 ABC transporter substrate-binding protein [Spongiactinospora sp. TRM90649]